MPKGSGSKAQAKSQGDYQCVIEIYYSLCLMGAASQDYC